MATNNDDSTQYKAEDIQRYVSGQMSAQQMHAMEKAALEDPFLAEAMEGFKEIQDVEQTNLTPHLEELRGRLKTRIQDTKRKTPAIAGWWRIAAVLVLLAGSGVLAYRLLNDSKENRKVSVAKNESTASADTSSQQYTRPAPAAVVDSTAVVLNDQVAAIKPPKISPLESKSRNRVITGQTEDAAPQALTMKREDTSITRNHERDVAAAPSVSREFDKPAIVQRRMTARSLGKQEPGNLFSGKVVSKDNEPVAGATVRVSGRNEMRFSTDSNGYFEFALPDTIAFVAVNAVGFETTDTTINSSLTDSRIRLAESKNALSEVVVVGYGKKKATKTSQNLGSKSPDAAPEIGFSEYNKYIQENKNDSAANKIHGDVVVSFVVNTDGRLSDFKIQKTLSKSADMEAIRLLKEGPRWKLSRNKKAKVEYTVTF